MALPLSTAPLQATQPLVVHASQPSREPPSTTIAVNVSKHSSATPECTVKISLSLHISDLSLLLSYYSLSHNPILQTIVSLGCPLQQAENPRQMPTPLISIVRPCHDHFATKCSNKSTLHAHPVRPLICSFYSLNLHDLNLLKLHKYPCQ